MVVSENPRIELIRGDCNPALKGMRDNEYDLAIVDPPFGIGSSAKKYNGFEEQLKFKKWNDLIPGKEYFDELFRTTKHQIIFGGNYFTDHLPPRKSWVVWDKMFIGNPNGFSEFELAWSNTSISAGRIARIRANDGFQNAKKKIHPTQKPEELYKWLLANYAKPGSTILDTHSGSASIAIAAYDMGFDLTCYELDKDYYKAAVERLQKHMRQKDAFKESNINTYGKQMSIQ